jgi:hypothetical protein
MADWPSTLPQSPLLEGFRDTPQDSVMRSEFDGYTKQRNRFTAVLNNVTERYYMTSTQYATFVNFYENTLSNGSEEFIKPDPVLNVSKPYRFVEPYDSERVGLDWIVTVTLEKLL